MGIFFWGGVREVMRSLLLFLLLAALTRCSPVSEPAAEPDPQPQPVPDPDADAHYGHWGYGRSIVLPTLWGASYGHHLHHHKRSALPEPHHGYNRYGFRGYRGWYGRRKRAADALPEPVAGPMPQPEADAHYGYYGYGGWGYPYYGYGWGYYWG